MIPTDKFDPYKDQIKLTAFSRHMRKMSGQEDASSRNSISGIQKEPFKTHNEDLSHVKTQRSL